MSILKLPRITTPERVELIPAASELLFDTTTNRIYIGDGATVGGIEVANNDISLDYYTLLTTTASISGDLQSQINSKQNNITLLAGSNVTITESPTDTWTISTSGGVTFNEPAADNSAGTHAIFDSATVGESVVFGDLLYLKSDGKWWKSDADAASTMPGLRMALESKSADQTCSMLVDGRVRNDAWNWTVGGIIYTSTISGELTQTQPSGSADIVQIVGVAYHASKMIFNPSAMTAEVL